MTQEVQGQFGGRVTFKFGNLTIPPADGDIEIEPSTFEVSAQANQDGTAAYLMKPKLVGAKLQLRNVGDIDWNSLVLQIANCTITEVTSGRTHLFTGTRLIGAANVNVSTGVVTGLTIEGGAYQMLGNS